MISRHRSPCAELAGQRLRYTAAYGPAVLKREADHLGYRADALSDRADALSGVTRMDLAARGPERGGALRWCEAGARLRFCHCIR